MRGFLYKILKFFLVLIVVLSGILTITFMLSYKNAGSLILDKDIHTLICGDSHTKTALNDSIIPNSLNIAHSSEHYLYTYNVLRVLLENNPQISTVILGLSYHNMSAFYDDNIFDEDRTQYMYPRYFTILDKESMKMILTNNFQGVLGDFKNIYHGLYRHIDAKELEDYSFIGWFYRSERMNKNDSTVGRAIQDHYYQADGSLQSFSALQLVYLKEIIELCHSKNLDLILINCPLSEEYLAGVPQQFIDNYNGLMKDYGQIYA